MAELMFVVTTKEGTRLAAFPSRFEAEEYLAEEEGAPFPCSSDWLYIETLEEDEDLYYSINS
jgi:hypothetical protein